MTKISAVYQIINTVTNERYVGSSKNAMMRWYEHRAPSTWKHYPNSLLYKDMQKYGVDKFRFQILAPVEPEYLKQVEQEFIEMLHPSYNDRRSEGWNVERIKETKIKTLRKYRQSGKSRKADRKARNKYNNQPCIYNGETLTLNTLAQQFLRAGVEHPFIEAKKYLIK